MNRGDHALERNDFDTAMQDRGRSRALSPASLEIPFRHTVSLLNAGRAPAAMPVLEGIFSAEPAWREMLQWLLAAQRLVVDEPVLARIVKTGKQTKETGQ